MKINTLDVNKILKFYLLEIKKKSLMKEKRLNDLLLNATKVENNADFELESFELIFEICLEKGYQIENFFDLYEECSLCDQQKFIHLVALQNDEILDMVFNFHRTFAPIDFCKEDLKSKFKLQMLENTYEVSI